VALLAIRLRGVRTSQVEIDAIIQKLLAFRAQPVLGTDHQTPAVDIKSLRPFVCLSAVDAEIAGEVFDLLFGLLASRRRSASD